MAKFIWLKSSCSFKLLRSGRLVSIEERQLTIKILFFNFFSVDAAGASFFIIMMHAATFITQEEVEGFDIEMDSIQTV